MDLKTFVAETLTQSVEGVQSAQERIAEGGSGAALNPDSIGHESQATHGDPTPVEFDVAILVTEESSDATRAKVGASVGILSVLTAKAAAEVDSTTSGGSKSETASRVKFSVMLAQPAKLRRRPPPRVIAPPSIL